MINLFIAVPAYGGKVYAEFTRCLLRLTGELGVRKIRHHVEFLTSESLISRGRNTLVAKFYSKKEFTHLLFLDADLLFNHLAIIAMLSRKKEIIGCPYPKKMYNLNKINELLQSGSTAEDILGEKQSLITDMNYNALENNVFIPKEGSCIEAKDIPTGCMLIKRSAITAMMLYYHDRQYQNNIAGLDENANKYYFDLFATGVVKNMYLSEDYYFCFLARSIGLQCWIESGFTFGHIGSTIYYGNLEEQLQHFGANDGLNLDKKLLLSYNECKQSIFTTIKKKSISIN